MRDGQQRPSQRDQQKLDARLLGISNTCREQRASSASARESRESGSGSARRTSEAGPPDVVCSKRREATSVSPSGLVGGLGQRARAGQVRPCASKGCELTSVLEQWHEGRSAGHELVEVGRPGDTALEQLGGHGSEDGEELWGVVRVGWVGVVVVVRVEIRWSVINKHFQKDCLEARSS